MNLFMTIGKKQSFLYQGFSKSPLSLPLSLSSLISQVTGPCSRKEEKNQSQHIAFNDGKCGGINGFEFSKMRK